MRKIPTLFRRDTDDMRHVTREVHPHCQWVIDGEGVATRKYDGTCVMLDEDGWWARREVKPGKPKPNDYREVETDPVTGKTVGWEPIEQSAFAKFWREAFEHDRRYDGIGGGFPSGTYELCGYKINGNPERFIGHVLVRHAEAVDLPDAPRDVDGLAKYLADFPHEGIVWHHPDGRMAKLKRRDFPEVTRRPPPPNSPPTRSTRTPTPTGTSCSPAEERTMTTDQTTQPLDLDAIRQRAEAATPGPWNEWPAGPMPNREVGPIDSHAVALVYERGERPVDADFIACAREDIPDLLAEIDRLAAVVDAARAWRNGDDVQQIGVDEIGVALVEAIDALDAGAGAR